ncbi:hypothetical protein GBA52_028831 [Prunus armeniaca]|nr:hypothetical protein GBA52_028831 [Prunus armeniaca]
MENSQELAQLDWQWKLARIVLSAYGHYRMDITKFWREFSHFNKFLRKSMLSDPLLGKRAVPTRPTMQLKLHHHSQLQSVFRDQPLDIQHQTWNLTIRVSPMP